MRIRRTLIALGLVLVALAAAATAGGGNRHFTATALSPASKLGTISAASAGPSANGLVSVIVKLDVAPVSSYQGGVAGMTATSPEATGKSLSLRSGASRLYRSYVDSKIEGFKRAAQSIAPSAQVTHTFDLVYGGVSMLVPADKVKDLAHLKGVLRVQPDTLQHVQTDASPQFIGAPSLWNKLGGQGSAGEGVIVGVLDTGIWPEHPSYSDPDPLGKPYPAPPPPLSGTRQCEFSGGANPGPAFTCNNKLIGADRFMATYDAVIGLAPGEFTTARDDDGHGSHTSSTAAGNRGVAASIFGIPRGTLSGIAPRAHVLMYKVCGEQGCFSSDSAAAVQKAIQDGVNVINFSISGGNNPYSDPVSLAFLDAYNAGVFVSASAGNSGPGADTVAHREPWTASVAASTANRAFVNTVTAKAGLNTLTVNGTSLTGGISTATPLVSAADAPYNDPFCADGTPDASFTGKIVICKRGAGIGRVQKGFNVLQRGAVGMVLYNNAPSVTDVETDNHFLPASHIQFADGQALLAFLAASPGATATMTQGIKGTQQGDVMASFSSRGGPGQPLGVSKPDITAPGVQILAANSPQHVGVAGGPQGELFQAIAGTSMSSPHIAGSAALIKDLNPTWTPGQIKSALMTTANEKGVVKEDGVTPADAFDDGSGRVDLTKASNPTLTFDETGANYVSLRSQLYRSNYPSLYIPDMPGIITVQRTVQSVINKREEWHLHAKGTPDMKIKVVPDVLKLNAGASGTFTITVDASTVPLGAVRFGNIDIDGAGAKLDFPVTIVRGTGPVPLNKTCAPALLQLGSNTLCTLTISNPTFDPANVNLTDKVPNRLQVVPGSATGGATISGNTVNWAGSLPASTPPTVAIAPGSSPAGGYLPLSLFGIPPVSGVTDDSITNFNVPSFTFAGDTYTQIGFSSNGYAVIGGGSGPDNSINNQNFPDPNRPNNVLAPFWTDLNPAAAGALRIGTLTDGSDTWIVLDWQGVQEFSTAGNKHSFQMWIGVDGDANPGEDISYAFGPNTGNGDGGFLSVGAENKFGNSGNNTYYNGTGTLPSNGTELRVTSTPGTASSKTITFQAKGLSNGPWTNCASMTTDITYGTTVSCFSGTVHS